MLFRSINVFSNCDEVELFVDGHSKGRKQPTKTEISGNIKNPPFIFNVNCMIPGTVKAVGYLKGDSICETSVTTAGKPDRISIKPDYSGVDAKRNDVMFIYSEIQDKDGNINRESNRPLRYTVTGNGRIIGDSVVIPQAGIAPLLIRLGNDIAPCNISAVYGDSIFNGISIIIKE